MPARSEDVPALPRACMRAPAAEASTRSSRPPVPNVFIWAFLGWSQHTGPMELPQGHHAFVQMRAPAHWGDSFVLSKGASHILIFASLKIINN